MIGSPDHGDIKTIMIKFGGDKNDYSFVFKWNTQIKQIVLLTILVYPQARLHYKKRCTFTMSVMLTSNNLLSSRMLLYLYTCNRDF